mgnify:CR=1 FL=1
MSRHRSLCDFFLSACRLIYQSSVDTDQLVHDEALLVWPERVLCKEDCKGLCPVCGKNQNLGFCGCDTTQRDPRMAKILDIFSNAGK